MMVNEQLAILFDATDHDNTTKEVGFTDYNDFLERMSELPRFTESVCVVPGKISYRPKAHIDYAHKCEAMLDIFETRTSQEWLEHKEETPVCDTGAEGERLTFLQWFCSTDYSTVFPPLTLLPEASFVVANIESNYDMMQRSEQSIADVICKQLCDEEECASRSDDGICTEHPTRICILDKDEEGHYIIHRMGKFVMCSLADYMVAVVTEMNVMANSVIEQEKMYKSMEEVARVVRDSWANMSKMQNTRDVYERAKEQALEVTQYNATILGARKSEKERMCKIKRAAKHYFERWLIRQTRGPIFADRYLFPD